MVSQSNLAVVRRRVPRSRGCVGFPTASTGSRRVVFPVSGSTLMTASTCSPSTPASPVLTSGSSITGPAPASMSSVPSSYLPAVARSRASRFEVVFVAHLGQLDLYESVLKFLGRLRGPRRSRLLLLLYSRLWSFRFACRFQRPLPSPRPHRRRV